MQWEVGVPVVDYVRSSSGHEDCKEEQITLEEAQFLNGLIK